MISFSISSKPQRRVQNTQELTRICALDRRSWTVEQGEDFATKLTDILKTPRGQMRLRPVQAISLFEMSMIGGVFGPQRCGAGKTLLSLLVPSVYQRVRNKGWRPLLVVPAGLIEKTERERRELAEHWNIVQFLKIMSYEWLGRPQAEKALEQYQPDLVILDECHKVKNTKSAVCRRLKRFFQEHSRLDKILAGGCDPIPCIAMSGTVTKRSLFDYAHIMRWCLPGHYQPLPMHFQDLIDWADALDERKERDNRDKAMSIEDAKNQKVVIDPKTDEEREKKRFRHGDIDPGDLRMLCNEEENLIWEMNPRHAARLAFRRRLVDTPGVVATVESPVDASLEIAAIKVDEVHEATEEAFEILRDNWLAPDGRELWDGLEVARKAREIAIGFHYIWDPEPPPEWLIPRRLWAKFVRSVLKHSKTLDSESVVRQWVRDMSTGVVAKPRHWTVEEFETNKQTLADWLAVRDTFKPNKVPIWIDTTVLDLVAKWAQQHGGIVWSEHTCFGERLERDFGITYYGRKGRNSLEQLIDDHPLRYPDRPAICASIPANKEGRNLQFWNKNLIVSMPSSGLIIEQLISRTHRDGQEADEVFVDVLLSCHEHQIAFNQACKDADYIQSSTGSPQKLMLAGIDFPQHGLLGVSRRWNK